jgi:hypothetical protein
VAEIVCPIQIYPLNYRPILDSVRARDGCWLSKRARLSADLEPRWSRRCIRLLLERR